MPTRYEDRSKEELLELAAERDIEGRSAMSKDELIAALRGGSSEGPPVADPPTLPAAGDPPPYTPAGEEPEQPAPGEAPGPAAAIAVEPRPEFARPGERSKGTPAEFPTDWHYERHLEDLGRELVGRKARLAEIKAMDDPDPATVKQAQGEVAAVREQLKHYGVGQEKASKRPAKASSKR